MQMGTSVNSRAKSGRSVKKRAGRGAERLWRSRPRCGRCRGGMGTEAGVTEPVRPAPPIVVTLAGQSMMRSDMRATAPAEVPVIQSLLNGRTRSKAT